MPLRASVCGGTSVDCAFWTLPPARGDLALYAQKRKLKQAEEAAAKLAKQQEEMSSLEKADLREAEAEVSFVPAESLVRDCSVARIPT